MSSPEPKEPAAKNEIICMMAATLMQRLIPPHETKLEEIDRVVYYCVAIAEKIYAQVEEGV